MNSLLAEGALVPKSLLPEWYLVIDGSSDSPRARARSRLHLKDKVCKLLIESVLALWTHCVAESELALSAILPAAYLSADKLQTLSYSLFLQTPQLGLLHNALEPMFRESPLV